MQHCFIRPTRPGRAVLSVFVLALLGASPLAAGAPHLSGRMQTDIGAGTLAAEVCLARLPERGAASFLLNPNLTIVALTDAASGRALRHSASAVNQDATRHSIADAVGQAGYCVSYAGSFVVYPVDQGVKSARNDWKGQIAFDGRTVRAADQSTFYPVAEDAASGAALVDVSYQIDLACANCGALYLSGAAPAAGPRATLRSDVPRPLLLYAGDFPVRATATTFFMGAAASAAESAAIERGLARIAALHQEYIGQPYTDKPAFLSFAAISADRQLGSTSWAFVSWPTIAVDGRLPFSSMVTDGGGRMELAASQQDWMSHEMAHHYFGTRYRARGPLKWFLLESSAEFLSLKAGRALHGEAAYQRALRRHYAQALTIEAPVALDQVRASEQIGQVYRYQLGPLLLVALESYAGEAALRRTLADLVRKAPERDMDYAAFKAYLLAQGADVDGLQRFERECLQAPLASGCLAARYAEAGPAVSALP